jgi:hypothetical protein
MLNQCTVRYASVHTLRYSSVASVLATLFGLMASTMAGAQSVVKWVDAQGQTHYSDHAPSGQDIETVSVHVSRPRFAPAISTSTILPVHKSTSATPTASNEAAAARAAEEEQRQAERREAEETSKAQADKDLIARCNQARETYCNQGADTIRQRETTRAEIQYGDAISARQDRISRGLRPGVLPPPPP